MSSAFDANSERNVDWIKEKPIAHRGLHNASAGIFENTLSATKAAAVAGYNIEIDLHISSDGVPMVFHDLTLDRLTAENGSIRDYRASELQKINILDTQDHIPTLEEFLQIAGSKVDVVLELKGHKETQKDAGFVEAVSNVLSNYKGNAAIMSFDHHLIRDAREIAPRLPLGLTAYGDNTMLDQHIKIANLCDVDFVSYELKNLNTQFVRDFKETGRPVISWTVKSEDDLAFSNKFAHQPTFEGFIP